MPVPGVSALRLHLANENSRLGRLLAERDSPHAPYWAHVWGGGLALARHIAAQPACVRNRQIIDYGTGSGLVAIAAAKAGAADVTACDIDPLALEVTRMNAALNGVRVATRLLGQSGNTVSDFPFGSNGTGSCPATVLAGDVFYDKGIARRSLAILAALGDAGADILIGDPFRIHLPVAQLSLIAQYDVADFASRGTLVAAGVFTLRRASPACS